MTDMKEAPVPERIYESIDEMLSSGATEIEYATIDGFKPGEKSRIGSVTANDMIEWSEANEGDAKRTAGLRLIAKSLVDKQGRRYASDPKTINDVVAKLGMMRHKETDRMVREILKLNGMKIGKDGATEAEGAAKKG